MTRALSSTWFPLAIVAGVIAVPVACAPPSPRSSRVTTEAIPSANASSRSTPVATTTATTSVTMNAITDAGIAAIADGGVAPPADAGPRRAPVAMRGPCVDPAKEWARTTKMPVSEFRPMSEQNPDLDGDGTPDWIYELGAVNTEVEVVVYVRRGQCGHQVLRFLLDSSATPLESVTHGLADLEGRSACRHECCNTWTFDGAKYRLRSTRIEPPAPNCRAAPSARP